MKAFRACRGKGWETGCQWRRIAGSPYIRSDAVIPKRCSVRLRTILAAPTSFRRALVSASSFETTRQCKASKLSNSVQVKYRTPNISFYDLNHPRTLQLAVERDILVRIRRELPDVKAIKELLSGNPKTMPKIRQITK